jgi:hypothetical protein
MDRFKIRYGRFSLQMPGEAFVLLLAKVGALLMLFHF